MHCSAGSERAPFAARLPQKEPCRHRSDVIAPGPSTSASAAAAATAMRLVNASPSPSQLLQAAGMPLLSSMSEPFLSTGEDSARGDALSAPPKPAAYQAALQDSTSALAELHEDLLEGILAKLGGNNRQALLGACKRLREAAAPTFTQLALPVPALHKDGYAATAGARMAPMRGLTLQLPAAPGTKDGSCVTDPCAATDAFIARCLAALPDGKLAVEVLRIQAAAEAQSNGSTPVPCQVSYEALAKLAAATPKLRRLSLPLLSSPAAAALPMFTQQLSTLRLTVSDSPSLDHALQLRNLQHLSVSTRKGLLYLVLSQRQLTELAGMSSLQTLTLTNVLINDCRASWEQLGTLTSLRELSVSSPLSAERLALLPASLQVLQLPFFSGNFESVGRPEVDIDVGDGMPITGRGFGFGAPAELRCRQAFTEADLTALSRLPNLVKLQCDNVVVLDAAAQAAQAALSRAFTLGQATCVAVEAAAEAAGLPVLSNIRSLHLSGYHTATGVLGVMFPNLEDLHVTSVTVPRPAPAHMAPMPHLHTLNWPSSSVLPAILAASPQLCSLSVTGINCQQRLGELVHMAPPPLSRQQELRDKQQAADGSKQLATAAAQVAADKQVACTAAPVPAVAADGYWWPAKLTELALCFSSTQRFRPKQIVATLAAAPAAMRDTVRTLCLRDQAQAQGPGRVVDDAVLAAALRSLPSVQRLLVSDTGAVTDAGVRAALAEAQPALASLTVAGCPKVSRAQAERMPYELVRHWLEVCWLAESGN